MIYGNEQYPAIHKFSEADLATILTECRKDPACMKFWNEFFAEAGKASTDSERLLLLFNKLIDKITGNLVASVNLATGKVQFRYALDGMATGPEVSAISLYGQAPFSISGQIGYSGFFTPPPGSHVATVEMSTWT